MSERNIGRYARRALPAAIVAGAILLTNGCDGKSPAQRKVETRQQATELQHIIKPAAEHLATLAIHDAEQDNTLWSPPQYLNNGHILIQEACSDSSITVELTGTKGKKLHAAHVTSVNIGLVGPNYTAVSWLDNPAESAAEADPRRWTAYGDTEGSAADGPTNWQTVPGYYMPGKGLQQTAEFLVGIIVKEFHQLTADGSSC